MRDPSPKQMPARPSTAKAVETSPCPRCGGRLLGPSGVTWCPACGYSPLLQQTPAAEPAAPARKPSKLGAAEFFRVVGVTPGWLWVLLLGIFAVVAVSLAADFLVIEDAHDRAVWGLWQLLLGLAVAVAAHVLAMRQVTVHEVRSRSHGSYSLTGLWQAALDRLPATRWPVNLLSWGAGLILCSVLIVGGLGWWLENVRFAPEKPKTLQGTADGQETTFKGR